MTHDIFAFSATCSLFLAAGPSFAAQDESDWHLAEDGESHSVPAGTPGKIIKWSCVRHPLQIDEEITSLYLRRGIEGGRDTSELIVAAQLSVLFADSSLREKRQMTLDPLAPFVRKGWSLNELPTGREGRLLFWRLSSNKREVWAYNDDGRHAWSFTPHAPMSNNWAGVIYKEGYQVFALNKGDGDVQHVLVLWPNGVNPVSIVDAHGESIASYDWGRGPPTAPLIRADIDDDGSEDCVYAQGDVVFARRLSDGTAIVRHQLTGNRAYASTLRHVHPELSPPGCKEFYVSWATDAQDWHSGLLRIQVDAQGGCTSSLERLEGSAVKPIMWRWSDFMFPNGPGMLYADCEPVAIQGGAVGLAGRVILVRVWDGTGALLLERVIDEGRVVTDGDAVVVPAHPESNTSQLLVGWGSAVWAFRFEITSQE